MDDVITSHPAMRPSAARLSIIAVVFLRSCFLCVLLVLIDNAIDFGTSLRVLGAAVIAGTVGASLLAFSRLRTFGFLMMLLTVYASIAAGSAVFSMLPLGKPGSFFLPMSLQEHLWLATVFFLASGLLTWGFWKWRHALTLELVVILAFSLHILSGHRNYHFESPRIMNNLAWMLGVQQLWVFVLAGAAIAGLLMLYIFCTSQPVKAVPYFEYIGFKPHHGRWNWRAGIFFILALAGLLYLICRLVFNHYESEALTRTANGVGEGGKEGLSPLDFHSALGSTSQSAALVRLEGDYGENPYAPMLYLRESALSGFDGTRMVEAGSEFDTDVTRTDPGQVWTGHEDPSLTPRVPLNQSVFLLTEHKLAFAVDYPVSINQLKNPNTRRFKAAFRAYSIAPAYRLEDLKYAKVGNPAWSQDVWQHYLRQHQDPRYRTLAREIAKEDMLRPEDKPDHYYYLSNDDASGMPLLLDRYFFEAFSTQFGETTKSATTAFNAYALVDYLTKNSIYTLTPNHDVGPNDDPVAAFLFGDRRGYCVHFAHATVYMLRALGIPSRIATGYLTDLSQSRDGHILLRMSDRHAWAEVYVSRVGWVPFDTQPEQVESHADTQVDMKLLEELMGMLGPSEDILPADIIKDETHVVEAAPNLLPDGNYVLAVAVAILVSFVTIKLYLRFAWLLPGAAPVQLRRSYRALLAYLCDLGYQRAHGETRDEFKRRINGMLGVETLTLTRDLNMLNYSSAGEAGLTPERVGEMREVDFKLTAGLPIWKRILAILSPASMLAFLGRSKW